MIFQNSRYVKTEVIEPLNSEGQRLRVLAMRRIPKTPKATEYVVMEGERLDHLAARFYGDAAKYWLILDANPEELNPLRLLQSGRRIAIPQNRIVRP